MEKGDWMKVVKKQELPVTGCVCATDVMYNMTSTSNTAVRLCMEAVKESKS